MTKPVTAMPKIQRNILLVFAAALLTIASFAALITLTNRKTRITEQLVNHTYNMNRLAEGIRSSVAESELFTREFITGRDQRWLPSLRSSWIRMRELGNEADSSAIDPTQREKLARLKQQIAAKISSQQQIIGQNTGNGQPIDGLGYDEEDRKITISIQTILNQFMQRQEQLLEERTLARTNARTRTTATTIAGAVFLFLFITGALLRLNQDIRRRKLVEQEVKTREAKYRRLIEDAGVTLFTCDTSGLFTYVNERCQQLTGFSQEELLGESFTSLLLPSWIGQITAIYLQQSRDQTPELSIEFPIITKDGDIKWVEQHSVILYNDQKNHIGYQCIVKDITEKRKQEEKLKQSEFRLRTILEKIGDNVWEHDFSNGRTNFSQTAYGLLGYQPHQFPDYARLWWACTHDDDKWILEENDRKYKAGIIDQHSEEYRMICYDGSEKWILDRGVVIDKMPDGTPIKILGTHTDITALKLRSKN